MNEPQRADIVHDFLSGCVRKLVRKCWWRHLSLVRIALSGCKVKWLLFTELGRHEGRSDSGGPLKLDSGISG